LLRFLFVVFALFLAACSSGQVAEKKQAVKEENPFHMTMHERVRKYNKFVAGNLKAARLGHQYAKSVASSVMRTTSALALDHQRLLDAKIPSHPVRIGNREFYHIVYHQLLGYGDCSLLTVVTSYYSYNQYGQRYLRSSIWGEDKVKACKMHFRDGIEYMLSTV